MKLDQYLYSCGIYPESIYKTPDGNYSVVFDQLSIEQLELMKETGLQVLSIISTDEKVTYRIKQQDPD